MQQSRVHVSRVMCNNVLSISVSKTDRFFTKTLSSKFAAVIVEERTTHQVYN